MMLATSGAADPQLVEGLQVKDPMFYQANTVGCRRKYFLSSHYRRAIDGKG